MLGTEPPPLGSSAAVLQASASAAPPLSALLPDGRIVLNLADAEQLDKLPGVGRKKAEAIVALRTKLGRFRKLEELARVRGIKRRFIERIRPLVVLDAPTTPPQSAASPP
jgi:competence protein ComEA